VSDIDWSALQPGDPDPEPDAVGEGCDRFVQNTATGLQFTCTRSPHDDPQHVSCAWWGAMRPADSVVVATWVDEPDGDSPVEVEVITPEQMTRINERAGRRRDNRMGKGASR
jgi:hypothetical protein